jgi:hypothetical protein
MVKLLTYFVFLFSIPALAEKKPLLFISYNAKQVQEDKYKGLFEKLENKINERGAICEFGARVLRPEQRAPYRFEGELNFNSDFDDGYMEVKIHLVNVDGLADKNHKEFDISGFYKASSTENWVQWVDKVAEDMSRLYNERKTVNLYIKVMSPEITDITLPFMGNNILIFPYKSHRDKYATNISKRRVDILWLGESYADCTLEESIHKIEFTQFGSLSAGPETQKIKEEIKAACKKMLAGKYSDICTSEKKGPFNTPLTTKENSKTIFKTGK